MADIEGFFNQYLPKKLAENPTLAGDINAIYVFDIDGEGAWTVDLTSGEGEVRQGGCDTAGCTVSAKKKDFETLLDKPASGMMLFTMGKLKVTNVDVDRQRLGLSLHGITADDSVGDPDYQEMDGTVEINGSTMDNLAGDAETEVIPPKDDSVPDVLETALPEEDWAD